MTPRCKMPADNDLCCASLKAQFLLSRCVIKLPFQRTVCFNSNSFVQAILMNAAGPSGVDLNLLTAGTFHIFKEIIQMVLKAITNPILLSGLSHIASPFPDSSLCIYSLQANVSDINQHNPTQVSPGSLRKPPLSCLLSCHHSTVSS